MDARRFVAGIVGVVKAMEAGSGVDARTFRGGRAMQNECLHGSKPLGPKSRKRKRRKRSPPPETKLWGSAGSRGIERG